MTQYGLAVTATNTNTYPQMFFVPVQDGGGGVIATIPIIYRGFHFIYNYIYALIIIIQIIIIIPFNYMYVAQATI